jgi:hypothetical protein
MIFDLPPVRLSIGLEDVEDLKEDIRQAFRAVIAVCHQSLFPIRSFLVLMKCTCKKN